MKRTLITLLGALLLCVWAATDAQAQASAQISGSVTDTTGALLPGVEITATQVDTGIIRTTITNETGSYVLPTLALGPYQLEASLPGFQTYRQTGIVLQVNASPVINISLNVGQLAQTVEVTAATALVETRSTAIGSIIDNERILELPLNGRNVQDLITLAGGAVNTGEGRGAGLVGGQSDQISVGGGAGWAVDYTLDGANHTSFITGSTMLMPYPDAMQEFTVEQTGVTAQRTKSTSVAAVTKSGTNAFHGNLFEFVRSDDLNAQGYFEPAKGTLKRHQFGGTAGGALVQNKLFFFGGLQRTTLRADPQDDQVLVPTAAMLAGDWTTFASAACGFRGSLPAPFVNGIIDPAEFSPAALALLNAPPPNKPFPTADDDCGNLTFAGSRDNDNENFWVGRLDFQQTDSHSIFGRVMIQDFAEANPFESNTNFLQPNGFRDSIQKSVTVGSTYVFNSGWINSFRFSFNESSNNYHQPEEIQFSWCDVGVNIHCDPNITTINRLSIRGGGFGVSHGFDEGWQYAAKAYGVNEDVSFLKGAHQIGFGFGYQFGDQANTGITWASQHQFTFNNLTAFMLGDVNTLFTGQTNDHLVKGTEYSVYVTDTWNARPGFTVTAGVRWEPYVSPNVKAIYNFDEDRFIAGTRTSQFLNAPAGFFYRGDPGFPENGVENRLGQFSPRVGWAWDVLGDGTTSLRSSYTFSYLDLPGDFREGFSGGAPWGSRLTFTNVNLDDPYATIPGGSTFPYAVDQNAPFPSVEALYMTQRYDTQQPYAQSWNLSLERQFAGEWAASAVYNGNNIVHVWTNQGINSAVYYPGVADGTGSCGTDSVYGLTFNGLTPGETCSTTRNTAERRRLALMDPTAPNQHGFLMQTDDGGVQQYHGMILSIRRRAVDGVNINANYTWSHCIGPYATLWGPMSMHPDDTYVDPNNRDLDQGDCDSDRRHLFNLTATAETPEFASPAMRMAFSGWRIAGIYKYSAGQPLNVILNTDQARNGLEGAADNQRPNQIAANPYGTAGPGDQYLNSSAFALPAVGTLGTMRRNSLAGFGEWSFDVALSRLFRFRESQSIELRAEAYNVTNSFRPAYPGGFGNPFLELTDGRGGSGRFFGTIRAAQDMRIFQFALKYAF